MNPDLLTSAERHLRHLCGAIEWSDEHYAKTGEHWTVETSEARAVADTTPAAAEPDENDDIDRVPPMPLNVDGALSAEDGRPVEPHDLDFYDDEEWALSVGKPWHAYRCTHDYFRHRRPTQTGDCDPWRRIPCPLT